MDLMQSQKELKSADPGQWLERHLGDIADEYLRTQRWMALPSPEFYRKPVNDIQKAAEHLVPRIRQAPEEAVWALTWRASRGIGMELRQRLRARRSFETLLVKFVQAGRGATGSEGQ